MELRRIRVFRDHWKLPHIFVKYILMSEILNMLMDIFTVMNDHKEQSVW